MKYILLKEISDIRGGKRIPKDLSLTTERTSHAYIRVTDMVNSSVIQLNNKFQYVPDSVFPRIKNYTVDSGDIILSIVGTIGVISLIGESLNKANLTENCVKITINTKEYLPKYVFYYLTSFMGQKQIFNSIVGSVQPKLPMYNIEKINVPMLSVDKQIRIVEQVEKFNDAMTLNRDLAFNLDKYITTLFYKWFIDFNFPDKNGNIYKDTGGELFDDEGKKIPKGWKIDILGNYVSLKNGINYSADTENVPNSKIISVKQLVRNSILDENMADDIYLPETTSHGYKIKKNDTIIARSASPGEAAISLEDLNVVYSGFSIRVRPNDEFWRYINYFNLLRLKRYITSFSDGTIIKNITQQSLSNFRIVIPPKMVVDKFNAIADPIFRNLSSLQEEHLLLQETRDLLIKKLIK